MEYIPRSDKSFECLSYTFINAARRLFEKSKPDLSEKTVEEKLETAKELLRPVLPHIAITHIHSLSSIKEKLSFYYTISKVADIAHDVIEEEPDNIPAHNILSNCLYTQGRAKEAKNIWETMVSRNPDNPHCLLGLAEAHNQLHDFPEARRLLNRALTLPCDPYVKQLIEARRDDLISTLEESSGFYL